MPKGHKLPDDLVEEICEMARAGIRVVAISHETGASVPIIYQIIRGAEIALPSKEVRHTPEQIADAIERYLFGDKPNKIREDCDMTVGEFYRYVREAGIEPSERAQNVQTERKRLLDVAVDMYLNTSALVWEICEETGVSQPTLTQELHRRKVPLRRPRRLSSHGGI